MRIFFQILLYSFISILTIALLEPYLSFNFLYKYLKIEKSIIMLLFVLAVIIIFIVIVGSNFTKFYKGSNVFGSLRHQTLFSLSIGIIINYLIKGSTPTSNSDLLFTILFYFSLIYLFLLFFLLLSIIEDSLRKHPIKKVDTGTFNDDPILEKSKDLLGRSDFAEHIATQILNTDDKFVIGLYGSWGTGKSSVVSLIQEMIPSSQPIVNFKPWYFGENNHAIIPTFIKMLSQEIDKQHDFQYELKKLLNDYANGLRNLTFTRGLKIGDLFHKYFDSQQNLSEIKEKIAMKLMESNKKIIVFIDEIDRLNPEEIQILFKLVRLVCDFPRVVYVLALDEEIVCQSLGMLYHTEINDKDNAKVVGRKYLEKFIQVPIYIPSIDYLQLKKFVINEIESLLNSQSIKSNFIVENKSEIYPILSQENWTGAMRNFKRFINLVSFFVPFLKDEVFIDDLLYMLYFKVFEPKLYDYIRDNPIVFLKESKTANEEIKKDMQQFKHLEKIITHLFPNVSIYFDSNVRPRIVNSTLSNGHILISDSKYFSKYFMYRTAYQEISEKEMARLRKELKQTDIEQSISEVMTFEEIYGLRKVLNKFSSDAQMFDETERYFITKVYKERYFQLDQYKEREGIAGMLIDIFKGKQNEFFNSVLLKEDPIPLYLVISIGEVLARYSKNRDKMEIKLKEILTSEIESKSLKDIFSNLKEPERAVIFIKWLSSETKTNLIQQKINDYIIDFHQFKELALYVWDEYNKLESKIVLLKLLVNFGVELSRKYLLENSSLFKNDDYQEMFSGLKKDFEEVYNYIQYELMTALEHSKKGSFAVKMDRSIELLIDILQRDENSKKDMERINELIEEINNYNTTVKG